MIDVVVLQRGVGALGSWGGDVVQQISHQAQAARYVVHALCTSRQQVAALVLHILWTVQFSSVQFSSVQFSSVQDVSPQPKLSSVCLSLVDDKLCLSMLRHWLQYQKKGP